MKKLFVILLAAAMLCALLSACDGEAFPLPDAQSGADSKAESAGTAGDESSISAGEESSKSSGVSSKIADPTQAKEFTSKLEWTDEGIEFCLPEDREGNLFTDCGLTCMVTGESYGNDVVAYHEYDKEGEITKKTAGKYTFDYQSFDYLGLPDWHMYVIRLASTDSPNQMAHRYYRIIYTVYGAEYPDSQIEKFMATINLPWEK